MFPKYFDRTVKRFPVPGAPVLGRTQDLLVALCEEVTITLVTYFNIII